MPTRIRRGIPAVALLVALVAASPAQASEEDTFTCVVTANVAFAPAIPGLPAGFLAAGAHTLGGALGSAVTCVHVDADSLTGLGDAIPDSGVWAGTIAGAGGYLNVTTCGGFVLSGGAASLTITLPGNSESPVTLSHLVPFVAGTGALEGMSADATGSTGPVAGALEFAPPLPCIPAAPLAGGPVAGTLIASLV